MAYLDYTEAADNVHDVKPLNFLHLNTAHIYHNYEPLAYIL